MSFADRHFDGIINQSVNVMPRALLVGSKITVDTQLVIGLLPKSLDCSRRSSKTGRFCRNVSKRHKTGRPYKPFYPVKFLDPRTCTQSRQARLTRKLRLHHRQGRLFQTVKNSDMCHSEFKT